MLYTTYFSKLRSLPAEIVPISISMYPPQGYNGPQYKVLAPSKSILSDYKRCQDWGRYVERFSCEILSPLDPVVVTRDLFALTGYRPFALTCFEKDHTMCHRSLVADWLRKFGLDIQEYGVQTDNAARSLSNS